MGSVFWEAVGKTEGRFDLIGERESILGTTVKQVNCLSETIESSFSYDSC